MGDIFSYRLRAAQPQQNFLIEKEAIFYFLQEIGKRMLSARIAPNHFDKIIAVAEM